MLESLRVFQLVARTASFTEAARVIALTRPAVSQHVKKLEQHFGVRLLLRSTRRVALTPAGEALLGYAERVLAAVAEMESTMTARREQASRSLVIGASTLPGEHIVPPALAFFRAAYPAAEVRVQVGDTDLVLDWVRGSQVDLGLVGRLVEDPQLVVETLVEDEIVLVLPPGSNGSPVVSLNELPNVPLVFREPGSATRATVVAALQQKGLHVGQLRVVAEMGSPEAVKAAVRAGIGAAFLSRMCVRPGEFHVARITKLDLRRPICACWRRDRPPAEHARALLAHLSTAVADRSSTSQGAGS